MNIYHLNSIDPVILDRGRDYAANGSVCSIQTVQENVYRAEVEGNYYMKFFWN